MGGLEGRETWVENCIWSWLKPHI